MRILLDTDVLLDVALAREPHLASSAAVLYWAQAGGRAAVAWHSLTNCSYLLKGGRPFLTKLLKFVDVATVGANDARILPDYRKSPVPAITPKQFPEKLK